MTTSPCEQVTERIALGEPLGELAEHVAGCARCERVARLPAQLGHARQEVDPGLGFAARMTVGAQQRLGVRRRQRIAGSLAASVAAAALCVFALTRSPAEAPREVAIQPQQPEPAPTEAQPEEIEQLVRLADTQRSRRMSAHWSRIQRPLAAYRALVNSDDTAAVTPVVAPTNGGSP